MTMLMTSDPTRTTRNTFTFVAGTTGAVGNHTIFTVTGAVFVKKVAAYCTANVTEAVAGATIQWGYVGGSNKFAGATDAETILANKLWNSETITADVVDFQQDFTYHHNFTLAANLIYYIGTQALSGGTIIFIVEWYPKTSDGNLVAATPA